MDISHGGIATAVADVAARPVPPASRKELISLTAASTGVLVGLIAGVRFADLMVESADEFWGFAPFKGWQFYLVAGVVAAVVLAVGVTCFRTARRLERGMVGRTQLRRIAVMAAIVPGLLLGVGIGGPMRSALSWASHHTAAAAKARTEVQRMMRQYRNGPPVVSYQGLSADDARLAQLLDPRLLGPDWHARYSAAMVLTMQGLPRATGGARALLTQQRWSANRWQRDQDVMESVVIFATASAARHYSSEWFRQSAECACTVPECSCTRSSRDIDHIHVRVLERHTRDLGVSHRASFAVGRRAFTLFVFPGDDHRPDNPRIGALLRAAVARAA